MTVVSNMSPLHYLILVGCDRVLPLLYGQVFTPPAVLDEMRALSTPDASGSKSISKTARLKVRRDRTQSRQSKNPDILGR
jgi:predicted nucleic acid-binding protein